MYLVAQGVGLKCITSANSLKLNVALFSINICNLNEKSLKMNR